MPLTGVYRDWHGEPGRRARAGKDILSLCLSPLELRVSIHPVSPISPRSMVRNGLRSFVHSMKSATKFFIMIKFSVLTPISPCNSANTKDQRLSTMLLCWFKILGQMGKQTEKLCKTNDLARIEAVHVVLLEWCASLPSKLGRQKYVSVRG